MRTGLIKKSLLALLVSTIIIYFLGWKFIGSNNFIYLKIKELIPPAVKATLKQTLFVLPAMRSEVNYLKNRNKYLEFKNGYMAGMLRTQLGTAYGMWGRYFEFDRPKVDCPKSAKVILVTGQSNAGNYLFSKEYENKRHVNFFKGSCYVLDNPVFGATGGQASVAPAIASKLISQLPYIFLTTGWVGTSIKAWSDEGPRLSEYTNEELKDLQKHGHDLSAVIWIQGESDSIWMCDKDTPSCTTPKKRIDYIKYFDLMKSKILQDLKNKQNVKFVITQTSVCGNELARDETLNAQQLQLGKDKNTYVTEVTDSLGEEYRHDRCHFNALGVEAIAEEISSVLNDILPS